MEQTVKPRKLWKKIVLGAAAVLAALLLVLAIAVFALWRNEIASMSSMRLLRERDDVHLDGAVYSMDVRGGFYLDDFVAQGGAKTDKELIDFITSKITKGLIKMNISESEIACSSFTAAAEDGDRRAATPPSPRWTSNSWASTWRRMWRGWPTGLPAWPYPIFPWTASTTRAWPAEST